VIRGYWFRGPKYVGRVKIWLDEHFSKREPPPEYDPDRETH